MIKLFKILLDSWKVIIDVYRELFSSDQINIQSYGQSNRATWINVKRECFNTPNPGEMVLTKQYQADIIIHAIEKSRAYIVPDSIILDDETIFTPIPDKPLRHQIRILNYSFMDWLIESWLYKQLKKLFKNKDKDKIIGVTLGYDLKPQLYFEDGTILVNQEADKLLYPEYYPDNCDWPIDPLTGEKLEISDES